MIRRVVCASLLMVLGGCATSAPGTAGTAASGPLVGTTCADVVVLGIRGSGQAADLNRGVGKEVLRTVTDLARRAAARSGSTLRLEAVPYDASGTATEPGYFQHVAAGARLARRQADAVLARCPRTRIGVVGFSQGAQVVHELADDVPTSLARRVVLVGLIADPRRNPADRIRHWAYADRPVPRPGLLGAGDPVDSEVRGATISFCNAYDEVCNGRGIRGEKTSAAHRLFYERPATAAATARQLDAVLAANGV